MGSSTAEDPDSYAKMRAAMAEADKLEKPPAKVRSVKPASTTNGVVAPTIVEGPSYPLRIRVSGIWKRIIRSDPDSKYFATLLVEADSNLTRAARIAGLHRVQLYRSMKRLAKK